MIIFRLKYTGKCHCNFLSKRKCLSASNVMRGFKLISFLNWIIFDSALLGLSDRAPDHSFAASSSVSVYYRPSEGRLNNTHVKGKGNGSWCPKPDDTEPYLQVQLDSLRKVTAVATQGHPFLHKWVTLFRMSYSRNGVTWTKIQKVPLTVSFSF